MLLRICKDFILISDKDTKTAFCSAWDCFERDFFFLDASELEDEGLKIRTFSSQAPVQVCFAMKLHRLEWPERTIVLVAPWYLAISIKVSLVNFCKRVRGRIVRSSDELCLYASLAFFLGLRLSKWYVWPAEPVAFSRVYGDSSDAEKTDGRPPPIWGEVEEAESQSLKSHDDE